MAEQVKSVVAERPATLTYAGLALASGAYDEAATLAALVEDPPGASYLGPGSVVCTDEEQHLAIHEMGHVWQYQNGGLAYIPDSLWAQFNAWRHSDTRNAAYNWKEQHRLGKPLETWNPEQHAEAIEDYNKLLRKSKDGTASITELSLLSDLLPYMQKVWAREGAPHFETPDLKDAPL